MNAKRIAAALLTLTLLATQLPSAQAKEIVSNGDSLVISSEVLEVTLNKAFPSIIEYKWRATGKTLKGNPYQINTVKIDNVDYQPHVAVTSGIKDAEYTLTFDEIQVVMKLTIAITNKAENQTTADDESIISYKVTDIKENGSFRVHTIEIPNNSIFTISSADASGHFVGVSNNGSVLKSGDTYLDLTTAGPDTNVQKYEYGIINDAGLAGTFRSNATSLKDNNLVLKQTTRTASGTETAIWSNKWTYRVPDYTKIFDDIRWDYTPRGTYTGSQYVPGALTFPTKVQAPSPGASLVSQNEQISKYPNVTVKYQDVATMELPIVEIVVTPDNNGDNVVDWMDGANAYRKIRYLPMGWETVKTSPVQRLIHPHSSLDAYTFMESLDETKRAYLATDGLGQIVLHKVFNYANWGDFTHYAENMGGFEDFKKFVDIATKEYNSYVGVHTNFTEVFAKSKNFRPETIEPGNGGYGGFGYWFHQCYTPDKTFEAVTKERRDRLVGFKESIPNLGFLYSDVFSESGLLDRRLVDDYEEAGLGYFVEWPYQSEERSVWSHWAVEKNYSPPNLCAYGSDVARFINNDIKDRWDNNKNFSGERVPGSSRLLMGADTTAWEGWMASGTNNEYESAIRKVFDNNIPTKYMQRNSITRWTRGTDGYVDHIWFENGVEAYFAGVVNNDQTRKRVIAQDGKKIYEGSAIDGVNDSQYLIPWELEENGVTEQEGKLYHWNELGGDSTWDLPDSWAGVATVKVYELSDQGKANEKILDVSNGKITLTNIKQSTSYVIYKGDKTPVKKDVNYGEGTPLKDRGFNNGTLDGVWTVQGGHASVIRDQRNAGDKVYRGYELLMGAGSTVVSQQAVGLEAGKEYAVSVMVEVQKGKTREAKLVVTPEGGTARDYSIKSSLWMESNVMSSKASTNMLTIRVTFTAPASGKADIQLVAGDGDAQVRFDNVRIYRTETPKSPDYAKKKVVLYQDFEYAPTGHVETKPYVMTGNDYLFTYEGYYPFVLNGSVHEPRIIIEQINSPYTQNGADAPWDQKTAIVDEVISGRNSLKIVGSSLGVILSTTPNTVQFEPGKEYRVTFKYQTQPALDYAISIGTKPNVAEDYDVLPPTSKSTIYTKTFVATSENQWIGFSRIANTEKEDPSPLVVDDVLIEEIGDGVLPSTPEVYGTYEFEKAEFTEGSKQTDPMKISDKANASGGQVVEFYQDQGDALTFSSVTVPKDGAYTLEIDYAAGYNSRTLAVLVNDGEPIMIQCPKTNGWGTYQTAKATVFLRAGANKLSFPIIGTVGLSEWEQGRINLDCVRVASRMSNAKNVSVYGKNMAEQLTKMDSVILYGIQLKKDSEQGVCLSGISKDSFIDFEGWNYRYGAGGISIMAKGLQGGKIEAYQGDTKLGEVNVASNSEETLYSLAFSRLVMGYANITLKFSGEGAGELMTVNWLQFTERRETEDSFLENGVKIQTNGGSGRGYINEFETGSYNPNKDERAVKFVVESDSAQLYNMELSYAFADSLAKDAFTLQVNGASQGMISFTNSGGWQKFSTVTVPVMLQKGMNVVSLSIKKDENGQFINTGRVSLDYARFIPNGFEASQKIEAELHDNGYGIVTNQSGDGTAYVENIESNSWISFQNVAFNKVPNQVAFAVQGKGSGSLRLLCDGEEIGTFIVNQVTDKADNIVFAIEGIEKGNHRIQVDFIQDGNSTIRLDGLYFAIQTNEIKLNKEVEFLYVNQSAVLVAQALPEEATEKGIVWSVDKPDVAKIAQDGTIVGLKTGSAVVTAASTTDETVYAKCVVEVRAPSWITQEAILEAENAKLTGGAAVNKNHPNYSGTGFVDGFFSTNYFATAEFGVNIEKEGVYTLAIRYAMGSFENQTCGLKINGTRLVEPLLFKKTASWETWAYLYRDVVLKAGVNTVSIALDGMTMGDTGNFNLDYIAVKPVDTAEKGTPVFPYVEVRTQPTVAPIMPQTIKAYYENGISEDLAITWQAIEPGLYATPGDTFTVSGKVTGTDTDVTCTIIVENEGDNSLKAALRRLYKEYSQLDETLYTKASWESLHNAMQEVDKVLKDVDATLEKINGSHLALQEAYNQLVLKYIQLEAEDMTPKGTANAEFSPSEKAGYTGNGIMSISIAAGNGVTKTLNATAGVYDLTLRYSHSWGSASGYPDFNISVVINGKVAATGTVHRTGTKWTEYGTTEIPGIELRGGENTIGVYVTDTNSDGWYALDHLVLSTKETEPDYTQLTSAITAATTAKTGVAVSADGKDVEPSKKWVTQAAMDTLDAAITAAQQMVDNRPTATAEEITAAVNTLNTAVDTFNTAKANGTKETTPIEPDPDDSYAPPPTTKTETRKNEDGSVTKIVTDIKTGTETETTTYMDGTKIVTTTTKDGSTTNEVTVSEGKGRVTVTIPAKVTTPGTVAVIVKPDGTKEIVKTSVAVEGGIRVTLTEGAKLELTDNSKTFLDVTTGDWFNGAVQFMASRELMGGTGENIFTPGGETTRAMLMTVLTRLDGQDTSKGETWYSAGVKWAVERGISDGTNPEQSITREQLVTMLYRYAKAPKATGTLAAFSDAGQVSPYAAEAMAWAVETGILRGDTAGNLNPRSYATRAEVAIILERFIKG